MSFANRVTYLREFDGLSQGKFAEKIGEKPGRVRSTESGRTTPGIDFAINIVRTYPGLSLDWLLLGEGPQYKSLEGLEESFEPIEGTRLAQLSSLARRGSTVQAWSVWRELSGWPQGLTKDELARALKMDMVDLESDLSLLGVYGLVSKHDERWKANQGQLISDDVAASAQHRMEVVGMLLKAPPTSGPRPSRLVTAALRVRPDRLEESKSRILQAIRHELEDLDEEDGHMLTVILGILDAEPDIG